MNLPRWIDPYIYDDDDDYVNVDYDDDYYDVSHHSYDEFCDECEYDILWCSQL